jgi:small-conductance mechanosensitive channel
MNPSHHIQAAVDPALLRRGRPLMPVAALERPRLRRLRDAVDIPALTRQIPTVEIFSGAVLGMIVGIVTGVFRAGVVDLGWSMIFGTVFGLLIGWLIATFTGATGTLSIRTVMANMLHILWVLTVVAFFVGIIGLLAALAGAAYGPDRRDL